MIRDIKQRSTIKFIENFNKGLFLMTEAISMNSLDSNQVEKIKKRKKKQYEKAHSA